MACEECLYFDAICERCSLSDGCAYSYGDEDDDECINCFFCVNGECQRVGGCRYDN